MTSTQSTAVDLVALRAWHFAASKDINREPEMRRWHKTQTQILTVKLQKHNKGSLNLLAIGGVELLVNAGRDGVHQCADKIFAGDWQKFCELAREEIAKARLRIS